MPVDIHAGTPNAEERVFTEASARKILDEIKTYFETDPLLVSISSWWGAGQRWARNTATLTSDQRQITVTMVDTKTGASCDSNQWDSQSLKGMAETVRYYADGVETAKRAHREALTEARTTAAELSLLYPRIANSAWSLIDSTSIRGLTMRSDAEQRTYDNARNSLMSQIADLANRR